MKTLNIDDKVVLSIRNNKSWHTREVFDYVFSGIIYTVDYIQNDQIKIKEAFGLHNKNMFKKYESN